MINTAVTVKNHLSDFLVTDRRGSRESETIVIQFISANVKD
jgi:hypothetical protein